VPTSARVLINPDSTLMIFMEKDKCDMAEFPITLSTIEITDYEFGCRFFYFSRLEFFGRANMLHEND
jgi:hypothetical protein